MRLPGIFSAAARSTCVISLGVIALLAAMPVMAHHSYAMFDMKQEIALDGTVRTFQWINPHVWIDIVVIDKNTGKPVNWSIETKGKVQLTTWQRDSMKVGDKVQVVIHPLKQAGTNGGSLVKIVVNGKELPL